MVRRSAGRGTSIADREPYYFRETCSPARASRRPRTGATGRCRRRHDVGVATSHGELPPASARRAGKLVATEPRQAMSDRWAVAVVDTSSCDVVDVGRPGLPADRRRDVCRGSADVADSRRDGRDERLDGTPVARTASQVGSRADVAPGAHQAATAFRGRCTTPARLYLRAAGAFRIG